MINLPEVPYLPCSQETLLMELEPIWEIDSQGCFWWKQVEEPEGEMNVLDHEGKRHSEREAE
jgi:hypothetical protein